MKSTAVSRNFAAAVLAVSATTLCAQIVAPPTPAPVIPVPPPAAEVLPSPVPRPGAPMPPPSPGDPETARPETSPNLEPSLPWQPEPQKFNPAPVVRVDVLMVSVPEDRAFELIAQLRDPAQVEKAEKRLLEMIARKEATLEGWPEITTLSQVRAVAESIIEQRYPIDFQTQGCASCLGAADKPIGQTPAPKSPLDEAAALAHNRASIVPTTFETRNAGSTLEADPVVSPDRAAVTISLVPQLVRFEGYQDFPAGTDEKGNKLSVPQPKFTTAKVSTTVTLRDGERRLIYVGKGTEDRSRIDLFILGAKISAPVGAK